jgi:1-acyl-sn-glycerol-3-phosphate acyltransferase
MYLITHLIVFLFLFPIGIPIVIIEPKNGPRIKKTVTGFLFSIIGQRLKVRGMENVETGKNYLIVSNYPGSYAGFALMNLFPEASMVVHSFLSKVPIVGFLLNSTGATFVQKKRFGRTRQAIDETLRRQDGKSIVILHEGGRSADGEIHEFKRGFIYILRHSSMDLLPVTLNGFYRLKPLKRPYLDPDAELEIVVHKPINRSTTDSIGNGVLVGLTVKTIEEVYRP